MTPKATSHVIKGMQKDTSKSKLSKEFAFDAKNIRITAGEDNTLLTITNERGTQKNNDIKGVYIGHCILQETLVLFTKYTNPETGKVSDYIININPNITIPTTLYEGDLNLSLDHPIEALGVYENEDIQKVYWVDGINQPRVINIKKSYMEGNKFKDASSFDFIPELELKEDVFVEPVSNSSMFAPGVIQYAFSYYNKYGQESNIFNVSPLCYLTHKNRGASPEETIKDLAFKVKVTNLDTKFDYIRIYSIHRTSLNAIPTVKRIIDLPISIPEKYTEIKESVSLCNLGTSNKLYFRRVAELPPNTPDLNGRLVTENIKPSMLGTTKIYDFTRIPNIYELVIGYYNSSNNFIVEKQIVVDNIASLQYKGFPTKLGDISTVYSYTLYPLDDSNTFILKYNKENPQIASVSYIDNGTLGETIDPTQLLYIGGEDIIAGTITAKDNTLFLGNIELKQLAVDSNLKTLIKNINISSQSKYLKNNEKSLDSYHYSNIFINDYSYFKPGEHYRLGIQLQYKNGKWSEPIFINDYTIPLGTNPTINATQISLPSPSFTLTEEVKSAIKEGGFKRIRGLVVLPEEHERKVLAQGMLCPTVYNNYYREKNNPYAQSSWLLRPNLNYELGDDDFSFNNAEENIEKGAVVEFRHGRSVITGANRGSEIQNNIPFNIDQSILTFHSPDIEFGNNIKDNINSNNVGIRIVGLINFTSNYGDIDIQTSTPSKKWSGFNHVKYTNLESGESSLISGSFYQDNNPDSSIAGGTVLIEGYLTYLWHRSGSLNWDNASLATQEDRVQYGILKNKKISNFKKSEFNTWLKREDIWEALGGNSVNSKANGTSNIFLFSKENNSLIKISNYLGENINYFGNVDSFLSTIKTNSIYNESEYPIYSESLNISGVSPKYEALPEEFNGSEPVRMKYKSSSHLVFSLNKSFNSSDINILPTIKNANGESINSLDGIIIGESSTTQSKEVVNVHYFYEGNDINNFTGAFLDGELCIQCYKTEINSHSYFRSYYLYKRLGNKWEKELDNDTYENHTYFGYYNNNLLELYRFYISDYIINNNKSTLTFIQKVNINSESSLYKRYNQDTLNISSEYPFLYIAELYAFDDYIQNAFGGTTEDAIKNNQWLPASRNYNLDSVEDSFIYEYGDTRYQRYDCLKTYAFTPEDENQVIEIASFMCETRVNMLGRYDKNIGNLSNLNADPTNFNLFNPVYSQKDNFFNYRILDSDIYKLDKFTNTVTWSKEKHLGEDVDTWTNITMANTLDLDGTKGKVNKLITFKDQIFAFQDKGISNILFNSRVQIPVSDGVPVEISNGMKVDGSRYISDNIGCQNKNSIVTTPSGVYFLDSESNGIYLLADGLTNLSTNKGFDIWTKEVSKDTSFKSFYDKNEKDIYFTTKDYCLGYSEKLGQFTSFYDYTDVETMFNIGTGFYSIKANSVGDQSIYQHSVGNYNEFYGEIKPYHLTIISNEDPQVDKVFTNLDYRADFFDSNNNYLENESFDTLEVWNEYQRGKETLKYSKFKPSNLKKKFRMWGANIPRDKKNKLDRMRNPWLYIKLSKEKPGTSKMELHDLVVKYLE